MEIEFEPVNKKEISVIAIQEGVRKKVGKIFTPGGSGHFIKNAIQVCGITEAFDFWGCYSFARNNIKDRVIARLMNRKDSYIQVKDIQLKFDWDVGLHDSYHCDMEKDCMGCYNDPCTCDRKDLNLRLSAEEVIEGRGK